MADTQGELGIELQTTVEQVPDLLDQDNLTELGNNAHNTYLFSQARYSGFCIALGILNTRKV